MLEDKAVGSRCDGCRDDTRENGSHSKLVVPAAEELTVISCALPIGERSKADNRSQKTYPAENWSRAKHYGERFERLASHHIAQILSEAGYYAVAPGGTPFFTVGRSERYGRASTWSERHAAYVSGLGTFGLCDGLITEMGKAAIFFSVIVKASIPPTPRPYTDHHAYCLHYARGLCGRCIDRCPAGAITEHGHDKERCHSYSREVVQPFARTNYGIDDYGCGLCQTGVGCESRNPVRRK
jgi:epoxyqueuosine reductase